MGLLTSSFSLWFILWLCWCPSQGLRDITGSNRKACFGTENGLNTVTGRKGEPALLMVKQMYENCQVVHGNLEIVRWDIIMLGDANDTNMNFLSDIEEVTGYVLIAENSIHNISLPKLSIIWGDNTFPVKMANRTTKFGLLINGNSVKNLHLPSLRLIQNGDFGFFQNRYLCHWRTVDKRTLMGDKWESRTMMNYNFDACTVDDSKCTGCSNCFGSDPSLCQQLYRNGCAEQCSTGMCFNASSPMYCCNSECAAGCFGPSNKDCNGCLKFRNDGKCVDTCPSKERYNPNTQRFDFDPNGKFAFNRDCVDTCPEHTRIYKDGCVVRCPDGYYEDESKYCQQCIGSCPKKCVVTGLLTEENIENFINCTHLDGHIEILANSFQPYTRWDENGTKHVTRGITTADLELLSNIQEVSDYVFIQQGGANYLNHSLNFLRNLRKIEGRFFQSHTFGTALTITSTQLEELGLRNLREITTGSVSISKNKKLCYINSLPWNSIVKSGKFSLKTNNANESYCSAEGKVCHASCEPSTGCWGAGPDMCFECRNYKLEGRCIDTCNPKQSLYTSQPKQCHHCHHECLECDGPGSRNCTLCRHVSLNQECVSHCPTTHYLDKSTNTNTCELCHPFCSPFGCTGPGNFVGAGGCNRCRFAVVDDKNEVSNCLETISPPDHLCSTILGKDNYFWSSPNSPTISAKVSSGICKPCHPNCRNCTGFGTDEFDNGCFCKPNLMRQVRADTNSYVCGTGCPNDFYNVSRGPGLASECLPCDPLCDDCVGPTSSDCLTCSHYKIMYSDGNKFNCTETCPDEYRYYNSATMICSNVDEKEAARQRLIAIACGISVLAFFVLVYVVGFFYYRRKAKMFSKLNPPDEKYEMNPDAKPDLSQLQLIILDSQLKIGEKPLGQGAFGVVYKGVYIRPEDKTKLPVAIKVLNEATPVAQQELLEEAGIMARMAHKHLVRLVGLCLSQQTMIVTPLMPLGNLLEFVQLNRHKIGSAALLRWCVQIADAMDYLESRRFVHRDLAARNVLVQNPHHVRITDFGLAKIIDYGQDQLEISQGKMPIKWLALECLQHKIFTHKTDVWAYGVTVWELLTFGDKPYKDKQGLHQIQAMLEEGERLPQPKICTLDVYMVLISCWVIDADSRPTFCALMEKFKKFLLDPGRYLVIENDKFLRLPSYTTKEQGQAVRDLLNDPDVCNPDDYFDDSQQNSSLPSTPTKPLIQELPQTRSHATHRNLSTSSHRYASDPLKSKNAPAITQLSTDNDNYLIPDSIKSSNLSTSTSDGSVSVYTPVVTSASGTGDKRLYYNDLPSPNGHSSNISAADNIEYLLPNSAKNRTPGKLTETPQGREIVQTETVV